MIRNPYNVYPNGNSIDALLTNEFVFTASADKIIQYSIQIYAFSTMEQVYGTIPIIKNIYNGDRVTTTIPIITNMVNGNSYVWNITMKEETPTIKITDGSVISASSTTNIIIRNDLKNYTNNYITINGETRLIVSGNETTGNITVSPGFSIIPEPNSLYSIKTDTLTSPYYYFKTRATPIVSITNYTPEMQSRQYKFIGSYLQSDNTPLKYYRFNIYSSDGSLLDTSGNIYRSDIEYLYELFLYDSSYFVQLIVETQDDILVDTGLLPIEVTYTPPFYDTNMIAVNECSENAVRVSWTGFKVTIGRVNGDYEFINNDILHIFKDSELYYDNLNELPLLLSAPFAILLKTSLGNAFVGKIIELHEGYYLEMMPDKLIYVKNNNTYTLIEFYDNENWILTTTGIPQPDTNYIWIDSSIWDDNMIWTESIPVDINGLKIAMTDGIYPEGSEVIVATNLS